MSSGKEILICKSQAPSTELRCKNCGLKIKKGPFGISGEWYHPTAGGDFTFCANAKGGRGNWRYTSTATPDVELITVNQILNKYEDR